MQKALTSRDFAFLEGPPGSGKTTAICELIQQLIAQGKRILLCGSTHASIDNVLERLHAKEAISALRIGHTERISVRVQSIQLDERVTQLLETWAQRQRFTDLHLPNAKTLPGGS